MNQIKIMWSVLSGIIVSFACFEYAAAQVNREPCLFANERYSTGAMLRQGDVVFVCNGSGTWQPETDETEQIANCLYAGRHYTQGSAIAMAPRIIKRCDKSGEWKKE